MTGIGVGEVRTQAPHACYGNGDYQFTNLHDCQHKHQSAVLAVSRSSHGIDSLSPESLRACMPFFLLQDLVCSFDERTTAANRWSVTDAAMADEMTSVLVR